MRGALATLLQIENDLYVIAESTHGDELAQLVTQEQPDVAVLDFDLPTTEPMSDLCHWLAQRCRVLVIAERRSAAGRSQEVAALVSCAGLMAADCPPDVLVESVRKVVRGETVLDGDLARVVLTATSNPLTDREREVLHLADEGLTARDIAMKLFLSHGTVRNYLSRVLAKTGARTRIEAIRIAREAGWL